MQVGFDAVHAQNSPHCTVGMKPHLQGTVHKALTRDSLMQNSLLPELSGRQSLSQTGILRQIVLINALPLQDGLGYDVLIFELRTHV